MRRMMTLLVFATSLAIAATASAQGWKGMARLQGVVTDAEGKPVKGATVMLRMRTDNRGPDVITDAKGKWAALGLIGGSWNIDIAADGYVTKQVSVEISESQRIPPLKSQLERAAVAASVEPKSVASSVAPEAVAAVEAGEAFMKEKKFKEAIVEFEKAQALLADHVQLKQVLAQAYYQAGQLKQAVALLEQVHAAEPTNTGVVLLLINLLLEDGKLDEGKALLAKVPEGAMTDPTALINIGILFMNKENPKDAFDFFNKAVVIDGTRGETFYYRGIASLQLKNLKEAKADFQKVVELAPESTEAKDAAEMLKQMK